ncbi:hypothetical protein GQ53DRAFT_86835 [Thozetella sp. PMI_491]|nr:hypothetical protein GQ53DRAFT_86835 [Thozetella sp. PMI_491]
MGPEKPRPERSQGQSFRSRAWVPHHRKTSKTAVDAWRSAPRPMQLVPQVILLGERGTNEAGGESQSGWPRPPYRPDTSSSVPLGGSKASRLAEHRHPRCGTRRFLFLQKRHASPHQLTHCVSSLPCSCISWPSFLVPLASRSSASAPSRAPNELTSRVRTTRSSKRTSERRIGSVGRLPVVPCLYCGSA